MIDPDISTADALRLLTARDNIDAAGMDRRRFLQMMGWGVGAGALFGGLGEVLAADLLPGRLREAWATTPVGPNEGPTRTACTTSSTAMSPFRRGRCCRSTARWACTRTCRT